MYTDKQKSWHKRRYQDRLKKRLCPQCGNVRDNEWITCSICREKCRKYSRGLTHEQRNASTNRYRKQCRENNICYRCGSSLRTDSHINCEKCREVRRINRMDADARRMLIKVNNVE